MRIPENVVERVRDSSDILSIVQDYVRLKKAGSNYTGLCPFHREKTASFNVNPARGFFQVLWVRQRWRHDHLCDGD